MVVNSAEAPWPKGWQPPVVVKPVRQGSSVGLQFVERVADWQPALAEALKFDSEVLVEEKIIGRETTVGILGGQAAAGGGSAAQGRQLRLSQQIYGRVHGVFLPGAI